MSIFRSFASAPASCTPQRDAVVSAQENSPMHPSASTDARRQFDRRPARANAIVQCREQFQSARIIDCSTGGLQLEGTFGLIKGDPVQIEFVSGIRLSGRVAWSLGAQTGVVFSEPLPKDHPVFAELLRRSVGKASQTVAAAPGTVGGHKRSHE
jgi:PilZ domain